MFDHIHDGWLSGAHRCPSPNCNPRPPDAPVSLLVIHNISLPPGEFGTGCVEAFFCNRLDTQAHPYFAGLVGVEVSAHLLIDRQGRPTQFVPLEQRAWHAGVSSFQGVPNCNDYSVGIELEGTDDTPYTEAQYRCLARLARRLMTEYPALTPQRIVGHSDIAPQRKTDPGPSFDWDDFRRRLNEP